MSKYSLMILLKRCHGIEDVYKFQLKKLTLKKEGMFDPSPFFLAHNFVKI